MKKTFLLAFSVLILLSSNQKISNTAKKSDGNELNQTESVDKKNVSLYPEKINTMNNDKELDIFCQKQLTKKVEPVPAEIIKQLEQPNQIKTISYQNCDEILTNKELQKQVGYSQLDDGGWYVAMVSQMPNVTKEMIDWWFWWHSQDALRYQMWFPGSHIDISFGKKDENYFKQPFNGFKPNTQYPNEIIGTIKGKLSIDFVYPTDFGFSQQAINESNVETFVCGHVGLGNAKIQHTEMCHIFFKNENGLTIVSRFWMGSNLSMKPSFGNKILNSKAIKSKIFTAQRAKDMAEHCCMEYRNLSTFLPELYSKFKDAQ